MPPDTGAADDAAVQRARLAVLISGRGSNLQAIVAASRAGTLDAEVCAVISNRPEAAGLAWARQTGIDTYVIDHRRFGEPVDRDAFDRALGARLEALQPDLIVLAGFMRILGPALVARFPGRILNIHPSLLPRYPGLDTHARALAAGDTEHGASVHVVTPELDGGPVIAQVRVPVQTDDTPASLAARVLAQEHTLYVNALQQYVHSGMRLDCQEC